MARIAIIGSGISGLAAADMLRGEHDVVVFEAAARAGGHARTVTVDGVPVDTGFIVYNEVNYPLLTRFLKDLAIATKPSDMSFGFGTADGAFEYCASSASGLLAQPRNLLSPSYWSMLRDILRFFKRAPEVLSAPTELTLGDMLAAGRYGPAFRTRFLIPMGAAIWSTPADQMLAFPAKTFVRFFQNHGLLSVNGHHPWRTLNGGSQSYVDAMARRLGPRLRLATPVARVAATPIGISVRPQGGTEDLFDEVIFACHADTALALLTDATTAERRVLSAFGFRDNKAVLHSDARVMPRARRAWASWNYCAPANNDGGSNITLTYWMNRLQSLPGRDLFVTLNPVGDIDPALVHDRHVFRHPQFTRAALAAQNAVPDIQGRRHIWFCGAWQRYGFHEDGIWSAQRVAQALGGAAAWS